MQAPSWLSKPPARKDEVDSTPSDSSFSAPPPAVKEDPYEKEDYSRYTSRGGSHSEPERRPMFEGGLYHPRLRGCLAQIRVERFDRRGTEPFEPFELLEPFEFFQIRNFP